MDFGNDIIGKFINVKNGFKNLCEVGFDVYFMFAKCIFICKKFNMIVNSTGYIKGFYIFRSVFP